MLQCHHKNVNAIKDMRLNCRNSLGRYLAKIVGYLLKRSGTLQLSMCRNLLNSYDGWLEGSSPFTALGRTISSSTIHLIVNMKAVESAPEVQEINKSQGN